METNIAKGIVAGFAATVVLSALMVMKSMMGMMPEMNAIRMLTGMAHHFMGTPSTPLVGWLLHFAIGSLAWGSLFAVLARFIPGGSPVIKGMLFGTGAWLLMMLIVMPMAGAGLFAVNLGIGAPVATLMLHWAFGAVLGAVYAKLAAGVPAQAGKHSHSHA